jgi:hypothetical protein
VHSACDHAKQAAKPVWQQRTSTRCGLEHGDLLAEHERLGFESSYTTQRLVCVSPVGATMGRTCRW